MPRPMLSLAFRFRRSALPVLLCLLTAASSHGQANTPTASRAADLQIGGGLTYAQHDYEFAAPADGQYISGATIYATLDVRPHLGVELNFRELSSHTADHLGERSYEIGPRYVLHFGRFNPYVRVSYGRGVFNFPDDVANLAYNMVAGGGGVDVNVLKHVNARIDFDYQDWLSFPGTNVQPRVGTVGLAYHF